MDAALKFMNFVLDPANSVLISLEFPNSNPNLAALDLMKTQEPEAYEAYINFPATNPSAEQLSRTYPVKDIGEATALWDRYLDGSQRRRIAARVFRQGFR